MADTVVMPAMGNTVESCLLTTWLVAVGDTVDATTPLAEIETDKSSMEVPVGVAGTVLALLVAEGDDVPVKQPIAIVGAPGESVGLAGEPAGPRGESVGPAGESGAPSGESVAPSGESLDPTGESVGTTSTGERVPVDGDAPKTGGESDTAPSDMAPTATVPRRAKPSATGGTTAVSPRARHLAASLGVDADDLEGTGPHGRVIARDVEAAAPRMTAGARATVAQIASGVIGPDVAGTGLGGRLTRADVAAEATTGPTIDTETTPGAEPIPAVGASSVAVTEPHAEATVSAETVVGGGTAVGTMSASPGAASSAATPVHVSAPTPGAVTETPLKGVRKIIADRMMESLAGSAQLTYTATAPATRLLALRARFKDSDPALGFTGVTVGDLVGYAAVRTIAAHPAINSHIVGGVVRTFAEVHLGMAVDTPRGLLVPTLFQACSLTLREFSVQSKELARQAIAGSINPDLLQGGTFTVSNLGAYGVESFTPLLNLPQVAILGVDAIVPRAVVHPDGSVGAEQRIGFSLTADHRLIDGADAARFLKDLCAAVADIDLIVMG